MSDYTNCALPKSESHWMDGVQMKNPQNSISLKQEVERFKRELQKLPDPNFGRIGELKEKIKNKTLITREAIEETAERIAERFMGRG